MLFNYYLIFVCIVIVVPVLVFLHVKAIIFIFVLLYENNTSLKRFDLLLVNLM